MAQPVTNPKGSLKFRKKNQPQPQPQRAQQAQTQAKQTARTGFEAGLDRYLSGNSRIHEAYQPRTSLRFKSKSNPWSAAPRSPTLADLPLWRPVKRERRGMKFKSQTPR